MKSLERLLRVDKALSVAERLLRYGTLLFGTTLTAALSGWAARATSALAVYAPGSWIAAALVGAIVFPACAALWASAWANITRAQIAKANAQPTDGINVLDEVFIKRRISLQTFAGVFNEPVVGKTFVDCELHGPAVIVLFGNVSMNGTGFRNCDLIKGGRDPRTVTFNAIPFQNITVTRGAFVGVTIIFLHQAVEPIQKAMPNVVWVTD